MQPLPSSSTELFTSADFCEVGDGRTRPGQSAFVARRGVSMSSKSTSSNKWTTITLQRGDVEALDSYAENHFGTQEVSYRAIVQSLLAKIDE